MPADIPSVPIHKRHFQPGQLQFITTSTSRRSRLFTCQRFCWIFVETLRQLRQEKAGELSRSVALVKLQILLSERFVRLGHGSRCLIRGIAELRSRQPPRTHCPIGAANQLVVAVIVNDTPRRGIIGGTTANGSNRPVA